MLLWHLLLVAITMAIASGGKIDTLVVLMMENRSFDHLLGFMKELNIEIDGCLPDNPVCTNPMDPANPNSERIPVSNRGRQIQMQDPHHSIADTTKQIYGYAGENRRATPPMSGFVKNYNEFGNGPHIMECMAPDHVPALSRLAQEFALFDAYHASVPGPTQVNRLFVHSATSYGSGFNDPTRMVLGYPQRTVFQSLDSTHVSPKPTWQVFFDQVPGTLLHNYTRSHLDRFHFRDQFAKHAAAGTLANYVFIEPRYFDYPGFPANDQHPNHDVGQGDLLIKETYEALRNGPKWNSTAFVITYDEHGGFFDHVPPAVGIPSPDGRIADTESPPFNFTRAGVRVPFVVVSPWVKKGTVVHAPATGGYEHSSIAATIRKLFAPDQPFLNRRDAWAATFDDVWDKSGLTAPRTDCPATLPWPLDSLHRDEKYISNGLPRLSELGAGPQSDFQKELLHLAIALDTGVDVSAQVETVSLSEKQSADLVSTHLHSYFTKQQRRPSAPESSVY